MDAFTNLSCNIEIYVAGNLCQNKTHYKSMPDYLITEGWPIPTFETTENGGSV